MQADTFLAPDFRTRRHRMVLEQLEARGISSVRVLEAMREVERERFVSANLADEAYDDRALPSALGQTISQPYIVALMTEALAIEPCHRVLEIGTGTGYQTAILAKLSRQVFTIERLEELSSAARQRLVALGLQNVSFRVGDGTLGWPEAAAFDRILVTAAAPQVVPTLLDQLADGGRMVLPVGEEPAQRLTLVERFRGKTIERPLVGVRFVRLIGAEGFAE